MFSVFTEAQDSENKQPKSSNITITCDFFPLATLLQANTTVASHEFLKILFHTNA